MITLDQIRILEQKVEEAVSLIQRLKQENKDLTAKCAALEEEKNSLTERISTYEADQDRIEQGIIQTLEKLNVIENSVLQVANYNQNDDSPSVQDSQSDLQNPQNTEERAYVNQENPSYGNAEEIPAEGYEDQQNADSCSDFAQDQNQNSQNNFNLDEQYRSEESPDQYSQNGQLDIF